MFAVIVLLSTVATCIDGEVVNYSLPSPAICQRCMQNVKQTVVYPESPESNCNETLTCLESGLSCPPGLFCEKEQCVCNDFYPYGIIKCKGSSSYLLNGNCATYDNDQNLLVGPCIFTMGNFTDGYMSLTKNSCSLNEDICKSFNRDGALCSSCLPNHYPLAYSFDMNCILCPHVGWNWLRYIMAAYLPLTLFYVIILFLKVNVTSSLLFFLVIYCQTLSAPFIIRPAIILVHVLVKPIFLPWTKVIISLCGIWNLDFFRPFYSDICLGIDPLPTIALDYAIAVYPLLLMVITYLLIVLHDRNYRVITAMWRPFRVLFSYYRRNWDIRTSVIDAYATFFLLSNIKFLNVTFDLLAPVHVYELHRNHYNYSLGLFYVADIEYFGSEHLPYGILAIIMCLFFVILPVTILVLYSFSFFQRFLNLFPVRCCIFIHTFMDEFQGCYKDGTEPGTRDCRWFSSIYFIFRFVILFIYSFILIKIWCIIGAFLCVVLALLTIIVQPFKSSVSHYNTVYSVLILLYSQLYMCVAGVLLSAYIVSQQVSNIIIHFIFVLSSLPFLCFLFFSCHWLFKQRRCFYTLMYRIKALRGGYHLLLESSEEDRISERIENPVDYPKGNLTNFIAT